jgi:putative transposase
MAKPKRPLKPSPKSPGTTRTFFVTSSTWERRNLFRSERMARLLVNVLYTYRQQGRYKLHEFVVMPDHIHLVVELLPTMSISQAFHLLKGASSRELFKRKPAFRGRYSKGHFWSPGKFYRTVGDADAETVIQYVRDHRLQQTSLNGFPSTT